MADAPVTTGSSRRIDLTGKKFGRWTVVRFVENRKAKLMWQCRCDCGTERLVHGGNLRKGLTISCGCHRNEVMSVIKRTHGASGYKGKDRGPLYVTWSDIRRRCYTPSAINFQHYGGRGIKMCDRWKDGESGMTGYECFVADMGPKPSRRHTVERKDTNGDYGPSNCEWATRDAQARNKRNNRWVVFGGQRMIITDAIKASGIPPWTVHERLAAGWSEDRALTQPVRKRRWRGPTTRAKEAESKE